MLIEQPEALCKQLCAAQGGNVTRTQAGEAGLTRRQIEGRVGSGLWIPELPGVFRDAAVAPSPDQRRWAGVLWASPGAVVSHRSAAVLWELDGVDEDRPEITLSYGRGKRDDRVAVHRTTRLTREDLRRIGRLPLTSPARTIIDLASQLSEEALEAAFESARRRGLVTPSALAKRLGVLGGTGRPGSTTLVELARRAEGQAPADSALEVKVARILRVAGVRDPVRQLRVRAFGRAFRADFGWPQERVVLECDGRASHGSRAAFQRDRTRWTAMTAAGWRVLVVTWDDAVHRPEVIVARVRAALAH